MRSSTTGVLQRAGCEEKYIQLKLSQESRIYLFELKALTFRCYQLNTQHDGTLHTEKPCVIIDSKGKESLTDLSALLHAVRMILL